MNKSSMYFDPEFRLGLGESAWAIGRRAARHGFARPARSLFRLAERIGGRDVRKAKVPLSYLYKFIDPVDAERISEYWKFMRQGGLGARW